MSRYAAVFACLLLLASARGIAAGPGPDARAWQDFWRSVDVDPAPPIGFLDVQFQGRVDNLTDGKISDETARAWVIADLRRSVGDLFASHQLREDIANAGVFGPPGLNGTAESIAALRRRKVASIEAPMMADFLAAAVISVPPEVRARAPEAGLTEFVVVLLFRPKKADAVLIYENGGREAIRRDRDPQLHWQLDTGRFVEHPVLGPLWFQEKGWSCRPDDSVVGRLCGLVKP